MFAELQVFLVSQKLLCLPIFRGFRFCSSLRVPSLPELAISKLDLAFIKYALHCLHHRVIDRLTRSEYKRLLMPLLPGYRDLPPLPRKSLR